MIRKQHICLELSSGDTLPLLCDKSSHSPFKLKKGKWEYKIQGWFFPSFIQKTLFFFTFEENKRTLLKLFGTHNGYSHYAGAFLLLLALFLYVDDSEVIITSHGETS